MVSRLRSRHGRERARKIFTIDNQTEEYPLLTDLWSIDHLEKHGLSMAKVHELDLRPGRDKLLGRLAENEDILWEAYDFLSAGERTKQNLTPAGIWLLDNFYLIEEQIQTIRRHFPQQYSRELPRLRSGPEAGLPRVYDSSTS
jgi:cyclic beta-1,2-glucan synthetase